MASSIVELTSSEGPVEHLGGKGRALARLVVEGFPVPPTAVVTTDAYRQMSQSSAVAATITDICSGSHVAADVVDEGAGKPWCKEQYL